MIKVNNRIIVKVAKGGYTCSVAAWKFAGRQTFDGNNKTYLSISDTLIDDATNESS